MLLALGYVYVSAAYTCGVKLFDLESMSRESVLLWIGSPVTMPVYLAMKAIKPIAQRK